MKNTTLFAFTFLVLLALWYFLMEATPGTGASAPGVIIEGGSQNGDVQSVTLGVKRGNYYPQEVRVRAGRPVALTLDASVYGCYRSFNIRGLGVSQYSKSPRELVKFTPQKAGTYRFSCSMGMGYGTLIVE